tara:strand:- start:52 stop:279 length:228 start_codon:yes stop_codon:yes gene_type:complete
MSTKIFPTLLNQKEVSLIIRKSEAWLERQRWLQEGIPYRKVGRNVLYDELDVLAFLEAQPQMLSRDQSIHGGQEI